MQDEQILAVLNQVVADGAEPNGKLPGIVAGFQKAGEPMRIASAGVRKWQSPEAIQPTDQMHIGSCTKAITATLIATMVDEGTMKWDMTIAEAIPKLAKHLHADYQTVTVRDLLLHRSGLQPNPTNWSSEEGKHVSSQRLAIAKKYLSQPAAQDKGTYTYSNLGYMVAGCMAEQVAKKQWEDLVREMIFEPLEITSGGFGPPGTTGAVDQPWGHVGSSLSPTQSDNPAALGPAGTIHLSLEDWAKFALQHCGGELNTIVSEESMQQLHRPAGEGPQDNYALGWMILDRPWGKGQVLTHGGSNTMWFATVWVAPNTQTTYLAATNFAGGKAGQIVDRVIASMIELDFGQTPDKIAIAAPPKKMQLDADKLQDFVGEYDYGPLGKLIVKLENDTLLAKLTGQSFLEVVPSSENELSWVDVDAQLKCKRDASGNIVSATHHQGGQQLPVKKIK